MPGRTMTVNSNEIYILQQALRQGDITSLAAEITKYINEPEFKECLLTALLSDGHLYNSIKPDSMLTHDAVNTLLDDNNLKDAAAYLLEDGKPLVAECIFVNIAKAATKEGEWLSSSFIENLHTYAFKTLSWRPMYFNQAMAPILATLTPAEAGRFTRDLSKLMFTTQSEVGAGKSDYVTDNIISTMTILLPAIENLPPAEMHQLFKANSPTSFMMLSAGDWLSTQPLVVEKLFKTAISTLSLDVFDGQPSISWLMERKLPEIKASVEMASFNAATGDAILAEVDDTEENYQVETLDQFMI